MNRTLILRPRYDTEALLAVTLEEGDTIVLGAKLAPTDTTLLLAALDFTETTLDGETAYTANLDLTTIPTTAWQGRTTLKTQAFIQVRDAENTIRYTRRFTLQLNKGLYNSEDAGDPVEPYLDLATANGLYLQEDGTITAENADKVALIEGLKSLKAGPAISEAATVSTLAKRTAAGYLISNVFATPNAAPTDGAILSVNGLFGYQNGVQTFSINTESGAASFSTPTASTHATTKAYVDAAASPTSPPRLTVWDTGAAGYLYIRCPVWDSTYDLLHVISRSVSPNYNWSYEAIGIILKTTASGGAPTYLSIASRGDSKAPYQTAGSGFFGGEHAAEIVAITKTSHGLTAPSAISKRYQDPTTTRYFRITNIPDANTIWLIPEAVSGVVANEPKFTKYLPTTGTTLTSPDGLSSLSGWTVAYTAPGPGVNGLSQQFLLDGAAIPVNCPPIEGDAVTIVEYHEVPDLRNAYTVAGTIGTSFTWAQAGSMWTRTIRTTIYPWAQEEVLDTTWIPEALRFNRCPPCQAEPLLGLSGAGEHFLWIPGAASVTFTGTTINGVSSPTLNFNGPIYVDGTCSGSDIVLSGSAHSINTGGIFPDFYIELSSTSSSNPALYTTAKICALDRTYGAGIPATRSAITDDWHIMNPASQKNYAPNRGKSNSALSNIYPVRAINSWCPNRTGTGLPTVWFYSKMGNTWQVHAAWTTNTGTHTITLPAWLRNLPCTLVGGLYATLTSTTTGPEGTLIYATTAAAGHIIVKLG